MGRSDPRFRRLPGRGKIAPGRLALGIAAVITIAAGAYELGRFHSGPAEPPRHSLLAATAPPRAAQSSRPVLSPAAVSPLAIAHPAVERAPTAPKEERAELEVAIARPRPAAAGPPAAPPTERPQTLHDKMVGCLSFLVENDEIHLGGYSPMATPVKVTVSNGCAFGFEGPEVSIEVRAIPLHGEGSIASAIGRFQQPIPARGSAETQFLLGCPRCDEVTHRFEARVSPEAGRRD